MHIFLQTNRLILRRFADEDAENLFHLDRDPEVMRYISGCQRTPYETIRDKILPRFHRYYQKYQHYGFWAALSKPQLDFIGMFHLHPLRDCPEEIELGYRLKRDVWGKGYATEGAKALIYKGFCELGANKIVAIALPQNIASIRVMQKVGLRFEKRYVLRDIAQEVVKYSLSREDLDATLS